VSLKSPLPESPKVFLIPPRDRCLSLSPSLQGQVEQWGSVHRKKDKKHQNGVQDSKDRSAPRDRADSRGGRGRGGRGGGRGGLSRGGAPGRSGQNGHRAHPSSRNEPVDLTTDITDPSTPASKDESAPSTSAWGSDPTPADQAHDSLFQATGTAWGESTPAWGADMKPNGTPSPAVQTKSLALVPGQPKQIPKKPATSKLSWAQVARCAPFHTDVLSIFLIRRTVHKRNPSRHPLPPPYNQPLLPLHLSVYLNNHSRSKKLSHPQNRSPPYQPLGKNLPLCKSPHGKKNPKDR